MCQLAPLAVWSLRTFWCHLDYPETSAVRYSVSMTVRSSVSFHWGQTLNCPQSTHAAHISDVCFALLVIFSSSKCVWAFLWLISSYLIFGYWLLSQIMNTVVMITVRVCVIRFCCLHARLPQLRLRAQDSVPGRRAERDGQRVRARRPRDVLAGGGGEPRGRPRARLGHVPRLPAAHRLHRRARPARGPARNRHDGVDLLRARYLFSPLLSSSLLSSSLLSSPLLSTPLLSSSSPPPLFAHSVHVLVRSLVCSLTSHWCTMSLSGGFCLRLWSTRVFSPSASSRRLALIAEARENSLCCWHDARAYLLNSSRTAARMSDARCRRCTRAVARDEAVAKSTHTYSTSAAIAKHCIRSARLGVERDAHTSVLH